jgi:hypothetical protein
MKARVREFATEMQSDLPIRHWAPALVVVSLAAWSFIFSAARLVAHLF